MQSNGTSPMEQPLPNEQNRQQRAEETFWQTLGTLWNWRRFIAGVTGAAQGLAVDGDDIPLTQQSSHLGQHAPESRIERLAVARRSG